MSAAQDILSRALEPPAVAFEGVSRRVTPRNGAAVAAVADVTLSIPRGEVFGIIGRSGAGTSTLLRMITGLERPDSGRVHVDGRDVGSLDENGLVALRRKAGMIFQGFNLLSASSVRDNVALPLRLAGVAKRAARARADEVLELVGLTDKADVYPSKLSGGQKQRAGIARALASNPDLLLSDEATSALDPETTRSILALLKDVSRRLGLTTILITHEMEVIRAIADRVAVMDAGRIVEVGPVWRVFGRPEHEITRSLLAHDEAVDREVLARDDEVVFALHFDGVDGREPDLFALGQILGAGARVVQGGVERLQGRVRGRLFVAAPRRNLANPDEVLARLRRLAGQVEIVSEGVWVDARQLV